MQAPGQQCFLLGCFRRPDYHQQRRQSVARADVPETLISLPRGMSLFAVVWVCSSMRLDDQQIAEL